MPIPLAGPISLKSQGALIKKPFYANNVKQQGFPFNRRGLSPRLPSEDKNHQEKNENGIYFYCSAFYLNTSKEASSALKALDIHLIRRAL